MKRFSVVLFIFLCLGMQASKNQELFLQANNAYLKSEFGQALTLYEQITNKGPAVWFNMANIQLIQENYLDALIYYKRAKKGAMLQTLQDVEKIVVDLQKKLNIHEQKNWYGKIRDSLFELVGLLPLLPLQLVCLLCALLFALSIILWRKKHLSILFGIIFLCSGLLLSIKSTGSARITAIIKKQTDVFVGPRRKFHSIANLTPGSQVTIKKRSDDWHKIKAPGLSGWVTADTITIL